MSDLEIFGRLALSLSGLLPASAASWGLADLYSPCPLYKGRIFGTLNCMLILFFSVLYLAEPVSATSSVSASLIVYSNSLGVTQITGILFIKVG